MSKYQARLKEKLFAFLKKINDEYGYGFDSETPLAKVMELLNKKAHGMEFVHGKGKRKSVIQHRIEELAGYIARESKYEAYNATFNGRNSFSKTDPDATFMLQCIKYFHKHTKERESRSFYVHIFSLFSRFYNFFFLHSSQLYKIRKPQEKKINEKYNWSNCTCYCQ